ncbi:MAG: Zn-dependent exopeptidase M28 [Thermoleophilia bacterium]|nr:Zn-dependent exopeptidase M28 [Thermoleophilia bacterium]
MLLVVGATTGLRGSPLGVGAGGGTSPQAAPRALRVDRFDAARAFAFLRWQVALGPRPAGSPASRRLAARLRARAPNARYQAVPGGLRNVIATVPGRNPRRLVVVGAHYDTKDIPGFVGANDGASATAVVLELARTVRPRRLRPTVVFIFFDGEESPAGTPGGQFETAGLRGSRVAAPRFRRAEAMVLLDLVGDRDLAIPREELSSPAVWARIRRAARRVGAGPVFPPRTRPGVLDDHVPFLRQGVPSVNLIDFEFPCWHRPCDDLSAVSRRSLDAVGEAVLEYLRSL